MQTVSIRAALVGLAAITATPVLAGSPADKLACGNAVRKDAVAACDRVLATPNLTRAERLMAHFNRGWAHRRTGANSEAIADFDAAEAQDGGFARLYLSRAEAKRDMGDMNGALLDLNRYIALDGGDWNGHYQRALIERRKGRHARALEDVTRALELKPFAKELGPLHVLTLADLGRLPAAKEAADRLVASRGSDATSRYARAVVAFRQKDHDAATADLDTALAAEPLFSAAYALKAQIDEARSDKAAAAENYRLARRSGGPTLDEAAAILLADSRLANLGPAARSATAATRAPGKVATAAGAAATKAAEPVGKQAAPQAKPAASEAKPEAPAKPRTKVECRRFVPSAGMTIAVPCGS
ncbi:MAG: tetratricopeptide repeat protein [Hyphomicrobiaceae bacterium]|nr:tetratricopeptide repeat protein [Hyphomicrobiaceae bacterium]